MWKATCAVRVPDARLCTSSVDSYSMIIAIKTVETLHLMISVTTGDVPCLACHPSQFAFKIDYLGSESMLQLD